MSPFCLSPVTILPHQRLRGVKPKPIYTATFQRPAERVYRPDKVSLWEPVKPGSAVALSGPAGATRPARPAAVKEDQ